MVTSMVVVQQALAKPRDFSPIRLGISLMMPEASNSNIHGYIHGKGAKSSCNTGGVEEILNK
jgi:hypothetical protein